MTRYIPAAQFLAAVVIALASLHGNYDAMGQENPVRVVTGLLATSQSLGWIGTEAGIFKRLGLEVKFRK